MSWHFSTDNFNWSQGNQGKGNVYASGDIDTWNIDELGSPHHQEKANEHGDNPVFLFYISPDGGVHDGGIGYSNTGDQSDDDFVKEICDRVGLHEASKDDMAMSEQPAPRVEDTGGYGHAWSLVSSSDDMASELRGWLSTFTSGKRSSPFDWAEELTDDEFTRTMDAYGPDAPESVVNASLERLGATSEEALDIREEWLRKALNSREAEFEGNPQRAVYYHVSPSFNRRNILRDGLTGHEDREGSPWAEGRFHWNQPMGNYLFSDYQGAREYVNALAHYSDYPVTEEHGYDIYKVDADGLPLFPDPENALSGGQSNLGDIYDAYQEGAEWDDGMNPVRLVTPSHIHPDRIQHLEWVEHNPLEYLSEDAVPDIWNRLPMTEMPYPGHESKTSSMSFELMSEAVKSIEEGVNEQRMSYEDATAKAAQDLAMYYYDSVPPEERDARMSDLIQRALQTAWNYIMAGGLVPWTDSGEEPNPATIEQMNFDWMPEAMTEKIPGWGEPEGSSMRTRWSSDAAPVSLAAKAAAWDKPSDDLSVDERAYVDQGINSHRKHRNVVTGEWCDCRYGTPVSARRTASESNSQLGTVLLVLPGVDEPSAHQLSLAKASLVAAGYQPIVCNGSDAQRPDDDPSVESYKDADAIYVLGGPFVSHEKDVKALKARFGDKPVVMDPVTSPNEAIEVIRGGNIQHFKEVGAKLDEATGKSPEDFKPDLKTDTGRRIFRQNQKVFRPDGLLQDEGRLAGPLALAKLDEFVDENQVEGMLPWLATQLKKGDLKAVLDSRGARLSIPSARVMRPMEQLAQWFAADQSPHRQGVDISSLSMDDALSKSAAHAEWIEDKNAMRRYQEALRGDETDLRAADERSAPDGDVSQLDPRERNVVDLDEMAQRMGHNPKPYEGWKVVRLFGGEDTRRESAILGHCIGSGDQPYDNAIQDGAIKAFSLRDPNGLPKATWHYNPDDETLAHIQGRSGYPSKYRSFITLFNNATVRDDAEGEQGDEYPLDDYGYGGVNYWDFGQIDNINHLRDVYHDPYELASEQGANGFGEDVEFDWTPNLEAIADDAIDGYEGWPEDFLSDAFREDAAMAPENLIGSVVRRAAERHGEQGKPFTAADLQQLVDEGILDQRLVDWVKLHTAPGKTDLRDFTPGAPRSITSPSVELKRDRFKELVDVEAERLAEQSGHTVWRHQQEAIENVRNQHPELFEISTGDLQTAEPSRWNWRPQQPFSPLQSLPIPIDENQPVLIHKGLPDTVETQPAGQAVRTLEQAPNFYVRNPLHTVQIPAQHDPALIAHEYYRILQSEGQQAANNWYYENYPDAQPSTQQLTSHETQ